MFYDCIPFFTTLCFPSKLKPEGLDMNDRLSCCASAAFGLEGLVADELREMKLTEVRTENGFVRFLASPEEIFPVFFDPPPGGSRPVFLFPSGF